MNPTNFLIPQEIIDNLHIPQVINIVDKLPVNPKYTWAQLECVRNLNDLTTVVLHHDALSKASTAKYDDVEIAKRIATSHIRSTRNVKGGDPGHPYHFMIRNGKVYQTNNILDFVYGVSSKNGFTIHVCVSGDYFNGDKLEDADKLALVGVVTALKRSLPCFKAIKGHGELSKTKCPGYSEDTIRSAVAALDIELNKQADKWDSKIKKIGYLRNEVAYMLENVLKGEKNGDAQKSMKKLMKQYEFMKQSGMLPPTAP